MRKWLLLCLLCVVVFTAGAQSLTSSNLPIIVINTGGQTIPDDPKIMADLGIIYNGEGKRNAFTDLFNDYSGKVGIEIRGQSSQQFPMKSYSIELWDNSGKSVDKSLFGLPKESDWVLYAPYTDKTLMRNFLAYTISRELGQWAANCRYVELVIDGDYKGIYVFMERIKRGSGRVPITKMAKTDNTGLAVTGGYIFSIDKEADGWFSAYATPNSKKGQRIQYTYTYPKITDITTEQRNYLQSYVDSFEQKLYSKDFQHPLKGWRSHADENSFIDYLLVNEVSRNVDGYRLSTYLYKERNQKIVAGPVWDYDLAFRNANYCNGSNTDGWSWQFNQTCPDDFWQVPFWWYQLSLDTAFQGKLRCRWKAVRQTSLSIGRLNTLIDSVVSLTAEARNRHFNRWPVLGKYVWPNPTPIPSDYVSEIDYLKDWLNRRLNWLDNNMPNAGACYDYPASAPEDIQLQASPNPFGNQLVLQIKSKQAFTMPVRIVNGQGQVIYEQQIPIKSGNNQIQLNAQRWPTGLLLFHATDNKHQPIHRVLLHQ